MKIATWNVNSLRVRLPHVLDWVAYAKPDIMALQETKVPDDAFPVAACEEAGFHVAFSGQKTYNGVAVLSRYPLSDPVTDFPGFENPQRRMLAVTVGDVRVLNVYVPNGSQVGSEKYQYKLTWLKHLTQFVKAQLKQYEKMIILGDFNIAPADIDVHDPAAWEGSVLVSDLERKAFQSLLKLGVVDLFRTLSDEPGFSWWDYRQAAFRRDRGLRIDHILCTEPLRALCQSCTVDKEPRTWERPSDHTPVAANFSIELAK